MKCFLVKAALGSVLLIFGSSAYADSASFDSKNAAEVCESFPGLELDAYHIGKGGTCLLDSSTDLSQLRQPLYRFDRLSRAVIDSDIFVVTNTANGSIAVVADQDVIYLLADGNEIGWDDVWGAISEVSTIGKDPHEIIADQLQKIDPGLPRHEANERAFEQLERTSRERNSRGSSSSSERSGANGPRNR